MIKLYNFDELKPEEILNRDIRAEKNVEDVVDGIIADVRARGDEALKDYALKFDGAVIENLQVTQEEIDEAFAGMDPYFLETLRQAAANIENFHRQQVHKNFVVNDKPGIVLGQKYTPIEKAGVYVPGGTAAYPSTVLMDVIPAKVAGVAEIVMTTPAGKDGKVNPVILAAAATAGVTKIFKTGGAQAVAALAYGTQSIPAVDKIVGPGNIYVATAKRKVFGKVGIDMMRIVDIIIALPSLLYTILLMMLMGSNVRSILIALCLSSWVGTARITRSQVVSLKHQEYALAAKLAGASDFQILLRHLLWAGTAGVGGELGLGGIPTFAGHQRFMEPLIDRVFPEGGAAAGGLPGAGGFVVGFLLLPPAPADEAAVDRVLQQVPQGRG